jgi:hypothetical protein
METQRKKQRQKNVFTMTSGGFVIAVRNNSLDDNKYHSLEPTYLVTILKTLMPTYMPSKLCTFLFIIIFSFFQTVPHHTAWKMISCYILKSPEIDLV